MLILYNHEQKNRPNAEVVNMATFVLGERKPKVKKSRIQLIIEWIKKLIRRIFK